MDNMFRFTQVPGQQVVEAYCKLAEKAEQAELLSGELIERARLEGFRRAVEIYCPDTPGFSCTSGYLIMAADRHLMALEAPNE